LQGTWKVRDTRRLGVSALADQISDPIEWACWIPSYFPTVLPCRSFSTRAPGSSRGRPSGGRCARIARDDPATTLVRDLWQVSPEFVFMLGQHAIPVDYCNAKQDRNDHAAELTFSAER
jgi:hypothetical protein